LATASRELPVITHHYTQNIDLRDAKTVSNSGTAIMGSAVSKVKIEPKESDHFGFRLPLLNDNKITGAKTYCCSSFRF
jgi:cell division protein FtsZ